MRNDKKNKSRKKLHSTVLLFFKNLFLFVCCLSCYSFNCVCGCPWGEIKISIMSQYTFCATWEDCT